VRSVRIQAALAKNHLDEDCKRAMRNPETFAAAALRDEHLRGRFFLRHPQLFHNVIKAKPHLPRIFA